MLTEKPNGFDFTENQQNVLTTLTKFTETTNQTQVSKEIPTLNYQQQVNTTSYNSFKELFEDTSMFHSDRDPNLNNFDSMNIEGNLNNNLGLEQIKEFEALYSGNYLSRCADIQMYTDLPDLLFEHEMTEKKEDTPPASPTPVVQPVEVKTEDTNTEFDLIKFIIFGDEVSFRKFDALEKSLSLFCPQNAQLITPQEEKPEPIFEIVEVKEEPEPEPSTSKAASPAPSTSYAVTEEPMGKRRRAPKRRYSSDSDFSVQTSASSFNATSKRSKKRGRPAKELITDLPTIEDFNDLPVEQASHLVLRIKNNEASRKSRMKSKSKQTQMEEECDRLEARKLRLKVKKNKYEGQIETLRRWLLGIN